MTETPSAIILAGNGINCEMETAHACRLGGFGQVDIVSMWELFHGDATLEPYHLLVLAGGFLDGDDLGSGKAQAHRLHHARVEKTGEPVMDQFLRFIQDRKLILGICNGFQLMVKLGFVPAMDGDYLRRRATLTHNDMSRFEDRWVVLRVNPDSPCIFTRGIESLYLPIRHGEGKFMAESKETLSALKEANLVATTYADPATGESTRKYPANPNGSQAAIAGICDPSGRLFGFMPHPEAFLHRTNHPRWTREELPEEGAGVALFRNACEYVQHTLCE